MTFYTVSAELFCIFKQEALCTSTHLRKAACLSGKKLRLMKQKCSSQITVDHRLQVGKSSVKLVCVNGNETEER